MEGGRHMAGQPEGDPATRCPAQQCAGMAGVGGADSRTSVCVEKPGVGAHATSRRGQGMQSGYAKYAGVLVVIISILAAFTLSDWPILDLRWPRAFTGEGNFGDLQTFDADMNPQLRRIMTSSGVIDTINTPVRV